MRWLVKPVKPLRASKRFQWHRWFAWYRVRVGGQYVWLEWVERKREMQYRNPVGIFDTGYISWWEYRQ